ncbi:energy-coupling factor transporter transmembrane component T family protein [Maridesulfovibrio sp. FT414]|uniref:energy-coupling factor transporter transmembrane component T family protein n=1 Tax=Maridesulfovibrio sp. FT414 TaxID=2979469 RepID=UPI003D8064BE
MQSGAISLYVSGTSRLHHLHPLSKLTYVLLAGVAVYCAPGGIWPDAVLFAVNLLLAAAAGVSGRVWKFSWRTLLPLAMFMIPIHGMLYPSNQTPLASYNGVTLYAEGLLFAGSTLLQLGAILTASLLFVFTTHPADFITSLTQAGCSSSLAYVLGSPLLMLPAMRARTAVIKDAQRARGLDSHGSFLSRARSVAPLIAPLVLGAFAEIEQRAIALELRGFNSGRAKTSLRVVRDSAREKFVRRLMLSLCLLLIIYKTVLLIHAAY